MKAFLSSILSFSLLIPAGGMVSAAGAAQGSRPSTPARASTTQQPADGGWPRAYITTSGARLVTCEPQTASRLDQKRMAMYAAVSYTPADRSSTACDQLKSLGSEFDSAVPGERRVIASTRRGAVYGPYGGAGYASRYNPRTGTYARGAATWGPGGARGASPGRSGIRGSRQKFDTDIWNNVNRAAAPMSQLSRDDGARVDGAQRTRDLGSINSGGGVRGGRL
jgi:hypothetical protein